jgi:hypothetical protein
MNGQTLFGGTVTYWTLSAWSDLDRLKAGWEPLGLGEFVPETRAPIACLRDALNEVVGNGVVLVRPLASKTGFTVVRENRGAEDNSYQQLFSARIPEGQSKPDFSVVSDETANVMGAFHKYVGRLTSHQVSAALVKVLYYLGGTRLRPTGGIYWLSGKQSRMWQEVTEAVGAAADGGKSIAYVINHDLDADSVIAVRDALVDEVRQETTRLAREIKDPELGDKAIETRRNEARSLRKKVAEYEQILGVGLEALKKGLDSVEQSSALADLILAGTPSEQEGVYGSVA